MTLQKLIPSLKLACSCALARHAAEDMNKDAYFAIGLDTNGTPSVFYVNDPNAPTIPKDTTSAVVIFTSGLIPLTVGVANLDLSHEDTVERMAHILLPNLAKQIFEAEPKDTRFLELATQLANHAANGITAAISAQDQPAVKPQPRLNECKHPERN